MTRGRAVGLCLCAVAAIGIYFYSAAPATAEPPFDGWEHHGLSQDLQIITLSSRPDMVSGGEVLVKISYPANQLLPMWVTLNGHDTTGVFRSGSETNTWIGLVSGLQLGSNVLQVRSKSPAGDQSLQLTNYPITGPIFSGPHHPVFICRTVEAGLDPPLDSDCSAQARVDYFYRSTSQTFKPLPSPTQYPTDMAMTTVMTGHIVPYIVRVESGTINRAIYRIGILDDPIHPPAGPWKPGPGWNGKLQYRFGGGCGSDAQQGLNQANSNLDDNSLSRGYALATTSLNIFGTACDDVLSAETTMMVKEYFIKHYGVPRYTMGQGGSGGAMQQHLIAQNYPGILNAIVPELSFSDGQTATQSDVHDCMLLNRFFTLNPWTTAQQTAVSGYAREGACSSNPGGWAQFIAQGNNSWTATVCNSAIPMAVRYDPLTNPTGVRCTVFDSQISEYGRNPHTGFAHRSLNNVGVQYGLVALNVGTITPQQFLDINAGIGGYDIDGNYLSGRTKADPAGVLLGYLTGRVFNGQGVFLPILDLRQYHDQIDDVHVRFHSYEARQRLIDANGNAANQIMWTVPNTSSANTMARGLALDLMDQWLENLLADTSNDDYRTKVIRAKPAPLVDGCWDSSEVRIDEPVTMDPNSRCNTLYPYHGNARIAAGSPIQGNIVQCTLKPIDPADYKVTFAQAQWAELEAIFPDGVCDYSKRGFGQYPPVAPWLSFGPAQPALGEWIDEVADHAEYMFEHH